MRVRFECCVLSTVLAFGLAGCGGAGSKPSEAQMKDAMGYAMNHPPGVTNSEPISIAFFKKEGCDKPAGRVGEYRRRDVQQHIHGLFL
jgi:hypothetical protein